MATSTTPSVQVRLLPSAMFSTTNGEILDLTKKNWRSWKPYVLQSLCMCGLGAYITDDLPCPAQAEEPIAYRNWITNDEAVRAFLAFKSTRAEQRFLQDCTTAATAWNALKTRHAERGAYTQALLVQELLACRYSRSERLSTTTARMKDLVERIFAIGISTSADLMSLCLLNAMSGDLAHLQLQTGIAISQAPPSAPYTPTDIIRDLEIEQQRVDDSTHAPSAEALVTKSGCRFVGSPKTCSNCMQRGHTFDSCFQPGGVMEDRRAEVLAQRKKAKRAERAQSGKGRGARIDLNGPRAFTV